ncbi:BAI1-associated protein 3-like isoform X2 [Rhipicephalus microplus]|uniref:BAI1-associated protein 3-like isoform X2 n=1 Tax=Rhipicephalus microplus TaxID=6941 RepID=UPI003F6D3705
MADPASQQHEGQHHRLFLDSTAPDSARCRRLTLKRGESSGAEWRSFDHGRPESDEENEHDGDPAVEERPEEVDPGVQDSDGGFFEDFTALSWKQENRRLQASREDDADKEKPIPTETELGIAHQEYQINKKEWEELYVEVLYTIEHKLGCSGGVSPGELHGYAQAAFGMPPDNHRRLLGLAREEKPPIPVLNVTVVEAQGLEAKDPNGYSDPYCMLGIQPCFNSDPQRRRRRSSSATSGCGSDEEPPSGGRSPAGSATGSPRRSLRKLGASFQKREPRSGSLEGVTVPAKFIRTTTVKPATLNPRWNERFRLDIDDIYTDRLHLDVWDHDDESSVFDAARKLNEVTGFKGLGRYFKQIAQSARSSPADTVDDFLGCVNVPLEDIPSSGLDQWFPLQGRSQRSTIQGQIRLKLSLGTREDRGMAASIDDNWKEVVEHQELLWIFIEHELRQLECPSYEWAGDLPAPALTILQQHAIQGDLTELQQAICRWVMYSRKHMAVSLDYALLWQLLDDLDRAWDDSDRPLSRDEDAVVIGGTRTAAAVLVNDVDEDYGSGDTCVTEISVEFQPTELAGHQKEHRHPGIKRKFVKFWKKRKSSWSSLRAGVKRQVPRLEEERELVAVDAAEDPNQDIPIRERLVIQAEVKEDTTPRLSKKEDSSANQYGPERQQRRVLPQEEACLAESFNVFIDYCLELLQKHRDLFPLTHEEAEHKLVHLLKCLALIYSMKAFQWSCPFRNQLTVEITNTLKKGCADWFRCTHALHQPLVLTEQTVLASLTELTNALNADLHKGIKYYNAVFETYVGVNYTAVVYKQLEKLAGAELPAKVQEVCGQVNAIDSAAQELSQEHISMGAALFELYMALQEFVRFREHIPQEDWPQLTMLNFHLWFADSVQGWFAVAKVKARQRIRKALELDRIKCIDSYVQHSTSAVDTTTCFGQIKQFWRQLAWPDLKGSYPFVFKILEAVCDGAMFYANLCHQKLLNAGYYDEEGQFDVSEEVCIVINNMEYVRRALKPLHNELELEPIIAAIEQAEGDRAADKCRAAFQALLHNADEDVVHKILTIIAGLSEKMRPEIKKFLFHLAWAPERLDADSALGPLIDYLDNNLRTLYESLMKVNFYRTLEAVWRVVLQELMLTARNNLGERVVFFQRLFSSLGVLLEFFHAEDKGLSLKSLHSLPYQDLDRLLKLHKADTADLIELYCLQRLEEQNRQIQSGIAPFGTLTVRLSYNAAAECLCVDVMNARDLQPLDPNGYSDPFVILEILPRHMFPDCPQQRTRVQKKTLYPLFDESFEFSVGQERCRQAVAILSFTVMDHDMMTRNDFEGEAFYALAAVAGVEDSVPIAPSQPVDLPLLQPKEKNEIMCALESRAWDKDALEFVRQQKKKKS